MIEAIYRFTLAPTTISDRLFVGGTLNDCDKQAEQVECISFERLNWSMSPPPPIEPQELSTPTSTPISPSNRTVVTVGETGVNVTNFFQDIGEAPGSVTVTHPPIRAFQLARDLIGAALEFQHLEGSTK